MEASTDVSKITNKLVNEIQKLDHYDHELALSAKTDYVQTYTSVMQYFYSRKPLRYRRTGHLSKIGRGYLRDTVGGIIISPSYSMYTYADYYNRKRRHIVITTNEVMDLMWNQGIRGLPPGYKGSMPFTAAADTVLGKMSNATPERLMENFHNKYINEFLPRRSQQYIMNNIHINFLRG